MDTITILTIDYGGARPHDKRFERHGFVNATEQELAAIAIRKDRAEHARQTERGRRIEPLQPASRHSWRDAHTNVRALRGTRCVFATATSAGAYEGVSLRLFKAAPDTANESPIVAWVNGRKP